MLYKLGRLTKQILPAVLSSFNLNGIGRAHSLNPTPQAIIALCQAQVSKTRFVERRLRHHGHDHMQQRPLI